MMLAKFNAKVNGINEALNRFVVNRAKLVRGTGLRKDSLVQLLGNYDCSRLFPFYLSGEKICLCVVKTAHK